MCKDWGRGFSVQHSVFSVKGVECRVQDLPRRRRMVYRGNSLIRNCPLPWDHRRALGRGLL